MVGVIIKCKFVSGFKKKNYSGYIDYSDRKEATNNDRIKNLSDMEKDILNEKERYEQLKNEGDNFFKSNFYDGNYSKIIDYSDRKSARNVKNKDRVEIFTKDIDRLNKEEKKKIKKDFDNAQRNKSILWEDIISFDNQWLEKNGLYDSKKKILDDKKIKEVIRSAMDVMLENEEMTESCLWCANIHYNTENIHVHVSSVEPIPLRKQQVIIKDGKTVVEYRGKRKAKSIAKMKSKIVNEITSNKEYLKEINDVIRKNIVMASKKNNFTMTREMRKLFKQIYKNLPEDRRQWNYNHNTISNVRQAIDNLSKLYIEKYHKEDFEKLIETLDKYEENLKESYGEGKNNSYKNYKKNKIDELYIRMGNRILKELRDYDKRKKENSILNFLDKNLANEFQKGRSLKSINKEVSYYVSRLKYILSDEYENFKNQLDYEKIEREIEYKK